MTKWSVEASQPAVYHIVTSTSDVHVRRGAMSVDDASIVCVPANDIDEAPEVKTHTEIGDMALYAS